MKKLKKPPTGWEDIFANHTPTTGLVSRIHKEFANKKTTRKKKKKKDNPNNNKKWANDNNRQFSQEDMQMAENT